MRLPLLRRSGRFYVACERASIHEAMCSNTRDVDDQVNRQRNRLACAPVRQADTGRQDTMCQARECLLR
jgi:hypothetical protein